MAAATLAAMLGLLGGPGLLSEAEAAAGEDLRVRYVRFSRAHAPHELVVEWVARNGVATVWITRPYLDSLEIRHIMPPPELTEVGPERVHYTFRTREPGAPTQVRFTVAPLRAGGADGHIGTGDGLEVAIRQFAFP